MSHHFGVKTSLLVCCHWVITSLLFNLIGVTLESYYCQFRVFRVVFDPCNHSMITGIKYNSKYSKFYTLIFYQVDRIADDIFSEKK